MSHSNKLLRKGLNRAWMKRIKTPLVVTIAVTDRCTRDCVFCRPAGEEDLPVEIILNTIRQAKDGGAVRINLTGGEPLIRDDIGRIIHFARDLDLEIDLWTNGDLVEKKLKDLMGLRQVVIGLDGPQEFHDQLRGKGSFSYAVGAARALHMQGINCSFQALICADSILELDSLIQAAERAGSAVAFRPAGQRLLLSDGENPVWEKFPQYRRTIDALIERKQKGLPILNSIQGLTHLREWPDRAPLKKCLWGYTACWVDAAGMLSMCHETSGEKVHPGVSVLEGGFLKAFEQLEPSVCDECWGAARSEMYQISQSHLSLWLKLMQLDRIG